MNSLSLYQYFVVLGPATWTLAADKPDIMMILLNKLFEDGNVLYKVRCYFCQPKVGFEKKTRHIKSRRMICVVTT